MVGKTKTTATKSQTFLYVSRLAPNNNKNYLKTGTATNLNPGAERAFAKSQTCLRFYRDHTQRA